MSWFEQQYEREPCDRWCPLGACQTCAFRGRRIRCGTVGYGARDGAGNGRKW